MASSIEMLRLELRQKLAAMPAETRAELTREVMQATGKWCASPGPQLAARDCKADVLLYGGEGGGGKSDLLVGLALTEHHRSLLMRRQYTDMGALTDRAIEINGTRKGFSGSIPPKMRTADGRLIEFGAAASVGDELHWQGQPHDLLGIDEVVQYAEIQVRLLMGWVRSTKEGQRKRVVFASNPPIGAQGTWIISMFAPWLDPTYSYPAEQGELRWVVTDPETGKDRWVDGPEVRVPDGIGDFLEPESRTFIRAKLADNPYLRDTGYKKKLDSLPEPARSAVRDGNFMAARIDDVNQVIPTQWVRLAQQRWTPNPPSGVPQCAIGVDGARVHDKSVLAARYDGWFAPLVAVPGEETPSGTELAALIIKHRRNQSVPVIDVIESVGAQAYQHLKDNNVTCVPFRGNDKTGRRTKEKQLGFFNKRSQVYWQFREALDPDQDGGSPIMLPDDPELTAELTTPLWDLAPQGIKITSKEDVVEILGRSPDKGDAVVMAWSDGAKMPSHYHAWRDGNYGTGRGSTPGVNLGRRQQARRR
jgi:hypothetical protein